ncbi:MAG: hypothetical protein ACKVQB_00560 [Bacteroidia bacterium]
MRYWLFLFLFFKFGLLRAQDYTGTLYGGYYSGYGYQLSPVINVKSSTGFYGEMRYNYEDDQTFSVYAGMTFYKNFSKTSETEFSPYLGGMFGKFEGTSPGFEIWHKTPHWDIFFQNQLPFKNRFKEGFYSNWSQLLYDTQRNFEFGASFQATQPLDKKINKEYYDFGLELACQIPKANLEFTFYGFNFWNNRSFFLAGIEYTVSK